MLNITLSERTLHYTTVPGGGSTLHCIALPYITIHFALHHGAWGWENIKITLQSQYITIHFSLHHTARGWECLPREQLEAVQPLPCYERPRT